MRAWTGCEPSDLERVITRALGQQGLTHRFRRDDGRYSSAARTVFDGLSPRRGCLRGFGGMWFDSAHPKAQFTLRRGPAHHERWAISERRGLGLVRRSGTALVRRDCWVPLGPGRDAGMTGAGGFGRRGLGAAWDVFSRLGGGCVQFWGRCVSFRGECVQFLAECVQFRGMCPLWRAMCPVFGGAPWLGMGHGRKARFLGSAALRSE